MNRKRILGFSWRIVLLLVFLAILSVRRAEVYGDSMVPTLVEGEVLLMDTLLFRMAGPDRFDLVVFDYRYQGDYSYIKRVIGLPGETIQIVDGIVYINGEPLEDDISSESIEKPKRAMVPIVLDENEYFVLGDNRNNSSDSRDYDIGNVLKDEIVGRVFFRVWPFQCFGFVR